MLVTAAGVSADVRMGSMGGRGTLAGAGSSVVARTTGSGRVTTGIIVDDLLKFCDPQGVPICVYKECAQIACM